MDTLMLKTFREVATRGSMKAASEHLYMAVSSVSSRVKALEDELGTELFVKQGTQYVLTPAGRHFLHYVDHFLRILEQANERVQAMREGHAGELHVATTTTVA